METFLAALAVFALAILAMSAGVLLKRRRLRSTCGALAGLRDADGAIDCQACSAPAADCQGVDWAREQAAQTAEHLTPKSKS